MTNQLYFVFDSHCPWSYACLPLVNEVAKAYPEMELHLWHAAHYAGKDSPSQNLIDAVKSDSVVKFSKDYEANLSRKKNSQIAANVMSWLTNKQPQHALNVLNSIMQQHFVENSDMDIPSNFEDIMADLKLSPPAKAFKDKLSNDAQQIIEDIGEIQELIRMRSFPIMLLAMGDNAVLLDHSHYLKHPAKIVEAVKLELNK
ncbi:MAG: protein-disulfide isomerase [Psychrobium sp.]